MAVSRPGGHKLGRRRWWQPGGLVAKSDTAVLALDALHGARGARVEERAVAAGAGAGRLVAERDAGLAHVGALHGRGGARVDQRGAAAGAGAGRLVAEHDAGFAALNALHGRGGARVDQRAAAAGASAGRLVAERDAALRAGDALHGIRGARGEQRHAADARPGGRVAEGDAAPAAELPKVMPLEDSPTRSIVPDDPCMSIEPRSARACRSFCSSVHTRVFFVAYLFLPKTGTATPWAWHRPPRDSSVLSTSFRQSPSSKSFLAPKQSDAGMPMAWQPLRNMLMLSICRKAMVDSETFLTLPGLIALISLHSRTPVFRFARKLR